MSGGRSKKVRCIQSYINAVDNTTYSGPMKTGLPPRVGVIKYYHDVYMTRCNQNPNAKKKSYANMVFLNINPSQTPVPAGFRQTANYNYSYNPPPGVGFYDANAKYDNHFYRPYNPPANISQPNDPRPPLNIHQGPYSKALRKYYK